jgi:SAM-dependent methyltransferase
VSHSLVYRSATGYELVMRVLYGRHYGARMRLVADEVPEGASVLELCCGPGTLYRKVLHGRTGAYIGLDLNDRFVTRLRRLGIDARRVDVAAAEPLPTADVVIMQASLYHFLPRPETIIDRMLAAAGDRVIIAEPVRNLASSTVPIVSAVARRAADPGAGSYGSRFTAGTLRALMSRYGDRITSSFTIPGGREQVYVLTSTGAAHETPEDPAAWPGQDPPHAHRSGTAAGS